MQARAVPLGPREKTRKRLELMIGRMPTVRRFGYQGGA
jgi:hypothetical protein